MLQSHRIKRAIVIPFAFSLAALVVLLCNAWLFTALPGERIMLTGVFLLLSYLFAEVVSRQATLGAQGLAIGKFLRHKELGWDEITHLGALVMGTKAYLLLTTTRGFYILSNNYEGFPALLRYLAETIPAERVGGEINGLLADPPQNSQPVHSARLMAAFMVAMIVLRLFVF